MADFDTLLEQFRLARSEGRSADARRDADGAMEAARAQADRVAYARALCAVGTCARDRGDSEAAERCYSEATDVYRGIGEHGRAAHALRHLGDVLADAGRFEDAAPVYDEVLALYAALPQAAPLDVANALRSSAICYEQVARLEEAADAWQRAHAFYERAGVAAGVEESARRLRP